MRENGEPENDTVWLWISVAIIIAIVSILIALYRDSIRHKPTPQKREAAEQATYS
jgi:ABC-type microcin C transport system permease subunit YejE